MSLSPWDVGTVFSFEFLVYQPRRHSYLRATCNRQRPSSYRRAVRDGESAQHRSGSGIEPEGSSLTSGMEEDYIDTVLRRSDLRNSWVSNSETTPEGTIEDILGLGNKTTSAINGVKNISITVNDELIDNISTPIPGCLHSDKNGGVTEQLPVICSLCQKKIKKKNSNGTNLRYKRNLSALCLGFILVYTAFRAVQNLLSTVVGANAGPDNLPFNTGCFCMTVVYLGMCLSCMITPQFTAHIKAKWCMLIGMATYLIWLLANLYPHLAILLPASALVGIGQSIGWSAQLVYLSKLYKDYYEEHQDKTAGASLYKYNALFLTCFQTTHIWGNLASAIFLRPWKSRDSFQTLATNSSHGLGTLNINNYAVSQRLCGKFDCYGDYSEMWFTRLPGYQSLLLCLIAMATSGFLVIIFFLQKIEAKTPLDSTCKQTLVQNLSQIVNDKTFRLLTPFLIFNGFEQAFIYADYNKSYVACALDVDSVGVSMIALGLASALVGLGLDSSAGRLPREAVIGSASVLHIGLLIVMLIWQPVKQSTIPLMIISVLLGICDAVWITQANVLIGTGCFTDSRIAFVNFRMLQALGAALAFALSCCVCFEIKVYILLCLLVVSIAAYVPAEYRIRKQWVKRLSEDIANTCQEEQTPLSELEPGPSVAEKEVGPSSRHDNGKTEETQPNKFHGNGSPYCINKNEAINSNPETDEGQSTYWERY